MTETNIDERPRDKKPLLLRVPTGVVLSVLLITGVCYGLWYFHLIFSSKMCAPDPAIVGPHIPSFVSCLNINEIGDALGGAFGPLAFLFLAGALLIQSMELAAQRWELDETQEVMREQLKVAQRQADLTEEQVKETKASTRLLERQTAILLQEEQIRNQHLADTAFDELIQNLYAVIEHCRDPNIYVLGENAHEGTQAVQLLPVKPREKSAALVAKTAQRLAEDAIDKLETRSFKVLRSSASSILDALQEAEEIVDRMQQLKDTLSLSHKVKADEMALLLIKDRWLYLSALIEEYAIGH